jgi:uncharacterized phage protein gp47/JayE
MTLVDGRFDPDDKEQILDEMIAAAEDAFGESLDPDQASVIRTFYDPIAGYLAQQQQDLRDVLDATRLEYAEGESLDLLGALIGITRNEAESATTRAEFSRNTPTTTDYLIPQETRVQTDEAEPVTFTTDQSAFLKFLDGFEDNNITEYVGDTATFTPSTTQAYDGTYSLEANNTVGTIYDADETVPRGSRLHARFYMGANTTAAVLFGTENDANTYRAVVDADTGAIRSEVVDGGSATTINTTSVGVPTGEWLHLEIYWGNEGEVELELFDSAGTSLETSAGTDSSQTYLTGGIGYASLDSNGTKYIDNYTMSAVSVPATSTTSGGETNVSEGRLVILPSPPTGIQDVTNPVAALDGRDDEEDDDFRERIQTELSEGARATVPALLSRLSNLDATASISVVENDKASPDSDGRPPKSVECVVEAPSEAYQEIAETVYYTKPGGIDAVGGYSGTEVTRQVELSNGDTKESAFSEPTTITIYVDCDIETEDTYQGADEVKDEIVQYVGGRLTSGANVRGDISAGDDVIYNSVIDAIMDAPGVYDVTNLEIDTNSTPTGTSNIAIASTENAETDATDSSIVVTETSI